MAEPPRSERDARRVKLVNLITLPLAFVLMAMGYALAQPVGAVRVLSQGLFLFSVCFNMLTVWLIERGAGGNAMRLARIYVNLAVNAGLVYLLGRHWPPIWMILALMPVSAAIYGNRVQTVVSCAQVVTALLVIEFLHGNFNLLDWGALVSRVLFIATLSLLINESIRVGELTVKS